MARKINAELIKAHATCMHETKIRNITNLRVSDGWFLNWRWQYNVSGELEIKQFRDLLLHVYMIV